MVSERQLIIKVQEETKKLERDKFVLSERIKDINKKIKINNEFLKTVRY